MAIPNLGREYALLVKSRGRSLIAYPLATVVGCLVASHGLPPMLPTALVLVSLFLVATCVYIYNDLIDSEMDGLNQKKQLRPIPSGKVSNRDAMNLVFLTGLAGIALGLFTKLEVFVLLSVFTVLFLSYSNPKIRLKRRFIIKEGTVAAGLLISTLMGGAIAGAISLGVVFQGLFFFSGTFVIYSIFVDYNDVEEDRKYGIKTLAIELGWKTKMEMAIFYLLTVMIIVTLTYSNFGFNVIFPIMIVGACLLFLRFLVPIINSFEKIKYDKAMKSMFAYWMLIQTALIIGSLPI